jgi:HSP20 family protein
LLIGESIRREPMVIRVTQSSRQPERAQESTAATPFRLFEEIFNDWYSRAPGQERADAWRPPVDILEKEGNLLLRVELPGVEEKEIDLKVEGRMLTVKGVKKAEAESDRCSYFRVETCAGGFSRSFTLPDSADTDKISASYKNGILTVTIPQKEEVRPRQIPVSAK